MRISDWSSDVCSSDLRLAAAFGGNARAVIANGNHGESRFGCQGHLHRRLAMAQGVGDQVVEQAGQRGGIGLDGHSGRVPPEKPYRVSCPLPGAYTLAEPAVEWQPLEPKCNRGRSAP